MKEKMKSREIVESYFADYFGHDLFETLDAEEIAEAIVVLNKLTNCVNEFFDLYEDAPETPTMSILAPGIDTQMLNKIRAYIEGLGEFKRKRAKEDK